MKKMKFLFGLFCCFILMFSSAVPVAAAPNDPVNIPDAELRALIETELSKAAGATITEADMAQLPNTIKKNIQNIRELTGLEHAINLTALQLLRTRPQTRAAINASPPLES